MQTTAGNLNESASGVIRLSRRDFSLRFEASSRLFWTIAAAILARRDGAEDVVQDAAVVALSKLDEFDARTSFNAWMSQIVRYTALNQVRIQRRRESLLQNGAVVVARSDNGKSRECVLSSSGQVRSDQSEFDDRTMKALAQLDDTARSCLLLRVVLDTPYREIALIMDIPEGSAMSHVHRARRELLGRLSMDRLTPADSTLTKDQT